MFLLGVNSNEFFLPFFFLMIYFICQELTSYEFEASKKKSLLSFPLVLRWGFCRFVAWGDSKMLII